LPESRSFLRFGTEWHNGCSTICQRRWQAPSSDEAQGWWLQMKFGQHLFRLACVLGAVSPFQAAVAETQPWTDGSSFNAPLGGHGGSSFNSVAGDYGRGADGNRTIVDGRFVGNCYSSRDGITPGVGSHSGVDRAPGFPSNPCTSGSSSPSTQNQAIGNTISVVTQGSWNTVIVDSKQVNNGNQTAILNGRINVN